MKNLQIINDFLSVKEIAIAGVSRDKKKFGFLIYTELKKKGYTVYPINPNTDLIDNTKCYNNISALPDSAGNLYIVTPISGTTQVMKEAIAKGFRNIWIQQKSDTPEAIALAKSEGINLIYGECLFMFISPNESFHKIHRFFRKLFGGMPK